MSYNGSGSFLINTAGQPVVSGTVISSTAFNALTADLATGLSTCITKDGQTTVTANIPMANYKFTGLGAGSAAADSANLSQVQSTVVKLLASVSGTDTITAVGSPTVAAYAAGQMFYFVAAGDNTGAVTLNIDSLGAKAVTRDGSVALAAGDIKSGEVVVIVYDGTRFQVVSQLNSSGDARFANVSIASALNVGGVATVTGGAVLNGGVVINEPGADVDFRVEGDTDANLIFADASADRVGIGTSSPATKLAINGGVQILAGNALNFQNAAADANGTISNSGASGNSTLSFNSGALLLNGSGNLGLGVTPSAWGSGLRAIQIGRDGFISAGTTFSEAYVGANTYYDGSNWKYATTNVAAFYSVGETAHKWYTAASGTAGNTITFGDAKMVLDASGRLGIGETSPTEKLQISAGKIKITGATVASGIASNTFRISGTQNVADDATVTVGIANASLVFVAENTAGNGILFFCGYSSGTVVKIADPAGIGATADTDGFICATKSATSSDINIKNRLGSTKGLTITVFSVAD